MKFRCYSLLCYFLTQSTLAVKIRIIKMTSNPVSPLRLTIEAAKTIRNGLFFTTDTVASVQSTVTSIPERVKQLEIQAQNVQKSVSSFPAKVTEIQKQVSKVPASIIEIKSSIEAVPVKIFDKIESTTRDVADVQNTIVTNIEYTASILNPNYIQKRIDVTTQDMQQKIGSAYNSAQEAYMILQLAYSITLKAFSPQTYEDYYRKLKEENDEKTYRALLKKQEERNKLRELVADLNEVKETIYSTIDTVEEVKMKAVLISDTISRRIDTFIAGINAIPKKVDSIVRDIRSVPDKIDEAKVNVNEKLAEIKTDMARMQDTFLSIIQDVEAIPTNIQTSYIATKSAIAAAPKAIQDDIDNRKRSLTQLATVVWRVVTLRDLFDAIATAQRSLKETADKIANIPTALKPKPKIVTPPAPVKKSTPVVVLESTWKALTVMVSTVQSVFQGLGYLRGRIDEDWKRIQEKEKAAQTSRRPTPQTVNIAPLSSLNVASKTDIQSPLEPSEAVVVAEPVFGQEDDDGYFVTLVTPVVVQPRNSSMTAV